MNVYDGQMDIVWCQPFKKKGDCVFVYSVHLALLLKQKQALHDGYNKIIVSSIVVYIL